MEKSLCSLAALIFLGGFFDAALMDDASTESYYSVLSNATATTATPTTTAASVTAERDHRAAQTTAESQLPSATVRVTQLDGRDRDEESREEDRDDSTQLGRTEKRNYGSRK